MLSLLFFISNKQTYLILKPVLAHSTMSQTLEEMKVEHEKMKLEKRKVDRETEDTRAKEIDHKRNNANEIEALEKAVEEKKELVASINEKNKVGDQKEILLSFIFNNLGA